MQLHHKWNGEGFDSACQYVSQLVIKNCVLSEFKLSTVETGYNDIGLCNISSVSPDILWFQLTLSWPVGHICPTYKESFQVHWNNSVPLFLHATLKYLYSVEPVRMHFSMEQQCTNNTVCKAAMQWPN